MRNRGGFTIVETLIVLGVTGVLFFATMSSISGRQGKTEFTQSMREIDARVRDTLNDVNNGFYPSVRNLSCKTPTSSGPPVLSYNSAQADTTGTNAECVLAGKIIQFGTDSDPSATRIYSLAGRRTVTFGGVTRDVVNIDELNPKVIKLNSAGHELDATEYNTLPSQIQLVKNDKQTVSYATVGIYYINFGSESANGQSSGVASVSIANLITGSHSESAVVSRAEDIANAEGDFITNDGSLTMCFKSGSSDQFATLVIKGASGGFTTDLEIGVDISGVPCV